jgi:hypothetical protein
MVGLHEKQIAELLDLPEMLFFCRHAFDYSVCRFQFSAHENSNPIFLQFVAMTYYFFCKYFKASVAAWLTALWFAVLFMIMFILSAYSERPFVYLNF